MKTLTLAFALLLASTSLAKTDNTANDFSGNTDEIKQIPTNEFAWRFHVTGEIFFVSADGERLINIANEKREWEYADSIDVPLVSNWRFQQAGEPTLALRQEWRIDAAGKITVHIQQYDDMERDPNSSGREVRVGKLLKEQTLVVKDFAPINWPVSAGSKRLVVRLTPNLWNNTEAIDVGALPIFGKDIAIFDGRGNVWADKVMGDRPATYFGVVTSRGSVFLSYVPFKGATHIGEAKNGRIRVSNGKRKVSLVSETPFVPKDAKVKVYGIISDAHTDNSNSVRTYSSSTEEEFLKRIK